VLLQYVGNSLPPPFLGEQEDHFGTRNEDQQEDHFGMEGVLHKKGWLQFGIFDLHQFSTLKYTMFVNLLKVTVQDAINLFLNYTLFINTPTFPGRSLKFDTPSVPK